MSKTDAEKAASAKVLRFVPTPRENPKKLDNPNKQTPAPGDGDNDPGPPAA